MRLFYVYISFCFIFGAEPFVIPSPFPRQRIPWSFPLSFRGSNATVRISVPSFHPMGFFRSSAPQNDIINPPLTVVQMERSDRGNLMVPPVIQREQRDRRNLCSVLSPMGFFRGSAPQNDIINPRLTVIQRERSDRGNPLPSRPQKTKPRPKKSSGGNLLYYLRRLFINQLGLGALIHAILGYDHFFHVFRGGDIVHHVDHKPLDNGAQSARARL